MANVDPSTFTTAAQIFSTNHTLPQIRSIHKSLHVQIEDKASRLRTQVGDSYRDLLGTADTIVHMRGDNDVVQGLLGKIGGRCGRAVIGAKATGLANFVTGESRSEAASAAKLRLLDACLLVVGRILKGGAGLDSGMKKGDRLVLATKVWVLARLLIKNIGDAVTNEASHRAMRTAKTTLDNLRRKLIRSEDTEREDVLKALCAYSLTTSSGARDVLRHFLHTRGEAIALSFEVDESERERRSTEDVIRSLKLYTKTLLDVQALVPGKLSLALGGLKKHPLLADTTMKSLEGLRLDVYERWCGEEIQYFTPYIRHDDFDGKQAREILMSWSEKGTNVLLAGLKKTLEQMSEFKAIMELRTQVLQLWIRDGGKVKGIDPSEMQDELREAINARMLAVLDTKVSKLRLVGSEIAGALARWKDGITDEHQSLWSDEGYDEALSNGAGPFVQEVVARLYGRNDAVSKAAHSYRSWYHVIDDVKEVVESLRRQRWDNDYDEIEDEETIEARQQLLSKDDPQTLQERLDTTLDKSFRELEDQVQKLWEERASAPNNGKIAMFFIRVLRDIRSQLPQRPEIKSFGLSMVPTLHSKVAVFSSKSALEEFAESELSIRTVGGRLLWEGEPALPNQPSPEVFQVLRTLSLTMADMGGDLWTPAAVKAMKQHLSKQLCEMWVKAVEELVSELEKKKPTADEKKEENEKAEKKGQEKENQEDKEDQERKDDKEDEIDKADKKDDEPKKAKEEPAEAESLLTSEQFSDLLRQWLFDVSLLRRCIGNSSESSDDEFKKLEDTVYTHTNLEDEQARHRVTRSAHDFWNRTSLLFGVLA